MATNLQVFKAPLPSTRPRLMGPANWRTWSKEMKMDLNNLNLYFPLHEHPPDPRKLFPRELSASTQDWLEQTSTDSEVEITPLTIAEEESAHLALLRNE